MFGLTVTFREAWAMVHGMVFGFGGLLSFTGAVALLYTLRGDLLTADGARSHLRWLRLATIALAVLSWLAVLSGTYIVYPWYRAAPPEGTIDLAAYPRSFLKADPSLKAWHSFGMEWKEHLAWFGAWISTAVAVVVQRYGVYIGRDRRLRWALIVLGTVAFAAAATAGMLGALVTKAAPLM